MDATTDVGRATTGDTCRVRWVGGSGVPCGGRCTVVCVLLCILYGLWS